MTSNLYTLIFMYILYIYICCVQKYCTHYNLYFGFVQIVICTISACTHYKFVQNWT